ncbi:MAG: hypothetical protein HY302_14690 [Opitutae bacterium]|nr:hypothetical protein [Opitutae bacterium]
MKTKLLLAVALAAPALACGPDFPDTIVDNFDAILAAPFARYADSLASISLPPAEFRARPLVSRPPPATDETAPEQALAAELADLAAARVPPAVIAQHRERRRALAALLPLGAHAVVPPALAPAVGLPPEFADYQAGVIALAEGRPTDAVVHWQRLLARPAAERKFKSTWAAFMLGRLDPDAGEARFRFRQVRQFARAGFADSLGLAAASYGWEAKTWLDAGDCARAADLYLAQFATGDRSAANSLRFTAARVLARGDDALLAAFARDPRRRETITALLLNQREGADFPRFSPHAPDLRPGDTARWLAALETAAASDAPGAARLALAAYRAYDLAACQRWLNLAGANDDLALWLRAKLALRDGRFDDAATLAQLVRHAPALDGLLVATDSLLGPRSAPAHLRGELGALRLARRDYAEALSHLLAAGCWEDAAYVAERVLSIDELKTFIATHAVPAPRVSPAEDRVADFGDLRHLLARRLVRHDRLAEARPYFPPALVPVFDQFVTLVRAGRDRAQPRAVRAAALMQAARCLRTEGLVLRGTELAPDAAIYDGQYPARLSLATRANLPPGLGPSRDERTRASVEETDPERRFHYRYLAADLAWEAIALMPDNRTTTAAALAEAGGWLKHRDPRLANRFYQALVRRCPDTDLGRAAAAQHWFPK